jgi:Flp pilus assembly pilin Flp
MIDPYTFYREEDGSLPIENAVFQALGAASVCWSVAPSGIFDETDALAVGHTLLAEIAEHEAEVAAKAVERYRDTVAALGAAKLQAQIDAVKDWVDTSSVRWSEEYEEEIDELVLILVGDIE